MEITILDAIEFFHRVCLYIPDTYECLINIMGIIPMPAEKGGKKKNRGIKIVNDLPDIRLARRSWAMLIYQKRRI